MYKIATNSIYENSQLQQILNMTSNLRGRQQHSMRHTQPLQARNTNVQIFASPPNQNSASPNLSTNPNQNILRQLNMNNSQSANTNPQSIQFPLQILQMAQNAQSNSNTPNNAPRTLLQQQQQQQQRRNAAAAQMNTMNGVNDLNTRMALLNQLRRAQAQQQHQQQQQQNSQHDGANNRQSIQQQMVAFIQQLQQFPPLFNHLQNNPQVLAQLLQQFRLKQQQNARDLQAQQRQLQQAAQAQAQSPSNNIQFCQNINVSQHNNNYNAVIRNIHTQINVSPQRQAQTQINVQTPAMSVNTNGSHNNNNNNNHNGNGNGTGGLLPALEMEMDDQKKNKELPNGKKGAAAEDEDDDVIILDPENTSNANANNSILPTHPSNNGNNSNVAVISMPDFSTVNTEQSKSDSTTVSTLSAPKKLDFSQLKTMDIPILNRTTSSTTLKRSFSSLNSVNSDNQSTTSTKVSSSNHHNNNKQPSKRRRLNKLYMHMYIVVVMLIDCLTLCCYMLIIRSGKPVSASSAESDKKNGRPVDNKTMMIKKKKKRKKNGRRHHQSHHQQPQKDELSDDNLSGNLSFKEIVDKAHCDGDFEQINPKNFANDPLISQIAAKMSSLRQIADSQRMSTPEATASISKGFDVLLQAIETMDDGKSLSPKKEKKKNEHSDKTAQIPTTRKNGELFVTNDDNQNCEATVQKVKNILQISPSNFFKLNENASLLSLENDKDLKEDLNKLTTQLSEYYNECLLNLYKTCSNEMYKEKFTECADDKMKYFAVWNDVISDNILSQMDEYLKKYQIQNAVALIFAIMDHLFSYSLYRHLCDINDEDANVKNGDEKPKEKETKIEFESERWIKNKGNLLFAQIENDQEKIKLIEEKCVFWLFEYWKKVLLQSEEPIKCLCRAYLTNSAPNPYKNKLYILITQIGHSPFTTVMASKSKQNTNHNFVRSSDGAISMSAVIKNNGNKNNIPSSSVCGKIFEHPSDCKQHSKHCKDCKQRIVTIQSKN